MNATRPVRALSPSRQIYCGHVPPCWFHGAELALAIHFRGFANGAWGVLWLVNARLDGAAVLGAGGACVYVWAWVWVCACG